MFKMKMQNKKYVIFIVFCESQNIRNQLTTIHRMATKPFNLQSKTHRIIGIYGRMLGIFRDVQRGKIRFLTKKWSQANCFSKRSTVEDQLTDIIGVVVFQIEVFFKRNRFTCHKSDLHYMKITEIENKIQQAQQ